MLNEVERLRDEALLIVVCEAFCVHHATQPGGKMDMMGQSHSTHSARNHTDCVVPLFRNIEAIA